MTDTIIHHVNVSYDETDERVRKFVSYLKGEARKNEMMGYYSSAKAMHPAGKNILVFGDEFTLVCDKDHHCSINLRGT